ncbi:MAG TPA: hypothetical protein VNO26_15035, partial [Candidatus Limnocylindria bacterium]|nr:hypothetical protein [Candidatus Limnocylindria bacterium]
MRRVRVVAAVLSALCAVSAVSGQAVRGCSVCPIDCPMHAARPERPGCHQSAAATRHEPEAPGGCVVRAT